MKKQVRYKHRVSWIENGKLKTEWFSNHKKAHDLFDEMFMKGIPVYYARKVSNALTAYQFDNVQLENGFGQAILNLSQQAAESKGDERK